MTGVVVIVVEDDDGDGEGRYVEAVYGPLSRDYAQEEQQRLRDEWADIERRDEPVRPATRTFSIVPLEAVPDRGTM